MSKEKVGVIIQARMGSSRLPGKSMIKIGSKPLIDHVVDRCIAAVPVSKVFLATTDLNEDNPLMEHVTKKYGITVFRGDKNDVRSRFEIIAKQHSLTKIVRITADDPFKDPHHIIEAINALDLFNVGYFNNFEVPVFPVGLDVESFRASLLFENIEKDSSDESKEHVTIGIRKSPDFVKKYRVGAPEFAQTRLTIDTQSDLDFCRSLIKVNPEIENIDFKWATLREALLAMEGQ